MSRDHHYLFAHRELATGGVRHGRLVLQAVRENGGWPKLPSLWQAVGERLPESDRLPADGLSARAHDLDGHAVVLVTMPEPTETAEAHFTAIVVPADEQAPVRYLTLERGWDIVNRQVYTVAGEWNADGHLNMGPGPEPTPEAFLAWLSARLTAGR